MKDEDLRDLFAFGAMISKAWVSGDMQEDAKKCYAIADAMIAAKYAEPVSEEGIVGVIKKTRKPKEA